MTSNSQTVLSRFNYYTLLLFSVFIFSIGGLSLYAAIKHSHDWSYLVALISFFIGGYQLFSILSKNVIKSTSPTDIS
jgi:hypothetical protein